MSEPFVFDQPKQDEPVEPTPFVPIDGADGAGGAATIPNAPSTDQTTGMTAAAKVSGQEAVSDRPNVGTVTPDDYPRTDPGRPDYRTEGDRRG